MRVVHGRYNDEERAEILVYMDQLNKRQGKGGQKAAQAKCRVSALTLKNWLRSRSARGSDTAGPDIQQTFGRMRLVAAARIQKLENELSGTREELEQLKRTLPSLAEQ